MSTTREPTYVDGWVEVGFDIHYRLVGRQDLVWFIQGPLNNVIDRPPVQLTQQEAMDWFRKEGDGLTRQEDRKNDEQ